MCTFVNIAEEPLTDFLHVSDTGLVQVRDQDRVFGRGRRRVNGVERVTVVVDIVLEQWYDSRLITQYI